MNLQEFLDLYSPLNLVTCDPSNKLLVAHDTDDEPFIILVKIKPTTYVALTNYEDPGVASNEFYITESAITHALFQDFGRLESMCAKAIHWAVRVKQTLRTTDDYYSTIDSSSNPFLRAIYEQYFFDLDIAIMTLAVLIIDCVNYPIQ
jgi:hypothetical protein